MKEYHLANETASLRLNTLGKGIAITSLVFAGGGEWVYSQPPPNPAGTSYDDLFRGGIEFLFPNDEPEQFAGLSYPDHGWLWRAAPVVTAGSNRLCAAWHSLPHNILAQCTVTLHAHAVRLGFCAQNLGEAAFPYLLRLHPAFTARQVVGTKFFARDAVFEIGTAENLEKPDSWPDELFCHMRQSQGRVEIAKRHESLALVYNARQLPYLTLYAKRQGHHHFIVPEPATAMGASLAGCEKRGTLAQLAPGGSVKMEIELRHLPTMERTP